MEVRKYKERTILMEKKIEKEKKGKYGRRELNDHENVFVCVRACVCVCVCVCVCARARVALHISYSF